MDTEHHEMYRPGGYHPVHLNDIFQNRYQVVHKLGHGSYSTVWLVEDLQSKRWASLKILTAAAHNSASEVGFTRYLRRKQADDRALGANHVVNYFDDFEIEGPNGTHQCIVAELLGPSLGTNLYEFDLFEENNYKYPADIAKEITIQVARGLVFLHGGGIVHGDLHVGNLLFYAPGMDRWSPEELEHYFGVPETIVPRDRHHNPINFSGPHEPRYLVMKPDPVEILKFCLRSPHVKIGDFGEAFRWENKPTIIELHTPRVYAAPEVLFCDCISLAVDIWAFASIIYALFRGGSVLFSERSIAELVLLGMVSLLGKLPHRWWIKWNERSEYFDDDAKYIGQRAQVRKLGQIWVTYPSEMETRMREELSGVVRMMLRYEPEERITAAEALELLLKCFAGD